MKELRAEIPSRDYDVLVGRGALQKLPAALQGLDGVDEVLVGCDENVAPLYLTETCASLREAVYAQVVTERVENDETRPLADVVADLVAVVRGNRSGESA